MSLVFPPIPRCVLTHDMVLYRLMSRDVGSMVWGSTDGLAGKVGWMIVKVVGFPAECPPPWTSSREDSMTSAARLYSVNWQRWAASKLCEYQVTP
jgi:hypothetical protein